MKTIKNKITFSGLFCISFFIISCAFPGVKYQDQVVAVDLTETIQKKIATRVLAKADEWRNSGVLVQKGEKYSVNASGKWSIGLGKWTGPDGVGDTIEIGTGSIKGWGLSILIGKVGHQGSPFVIGSNHKFIANRNGILYFMMNDTNGGFWDNKGFVNVTTTTIVEIMDAEEKVNPTLQATSKLKTVYPRSSLDFSTNWAIIIGISKYQYSGQNGLNNLIFADDDAKAFARVLNNLGWSASHIKLLINEQATERNIKIALKSWLTKAGSNDQIVLFWAGHGFPDPEDPEKVYLATYDTDISIPATGYRMDEVNTALKEIGAKNVILLADTCHAGKLITRGDGGRGISIIPNIKKQIVPKGWVFMVGADTDRQAIEHSSWSNGAFTHSLIKGLNGEADGFQSAGAKDGVVTMGELKEFMNISMPEETLKVLGVAKRPVITTSTGDPGIWDLTLQVK